MHTVHGHQNCTPPCNINDVDSVFQISQPLYTEMPERLSRLNYVLKYYVNTSVILLLWRKGRRPALVYISIAQYYKNIFIDIHYGISSTLLYVIIPNVVSLCYETKIDVETFVV